ncbi:N-acetylmuramoyl-L-alanine amidase [Gordonia sihwensis]|uniref:N-acetylmuramoyl-L-alanine amidase n=1 Tax=Gordonia sihwensis TaxID=173559 RepID=UPI0024174C7D|nr:N-acetylmuramoyl-L-alanine amidase [Gordonia sihwensis]WFN91471.1 N-acetylmuramoyl-L-alanine amidase [Gordonia sihwensis]WFN91529.1 N-acetylmuramoyl-L-alanine amidase [Gordonia sihwensis]
MGKPTFRYLELLGPNRQSRNGARVPYFFLHTEEGSSTAENLVRSGNASGAFSYHYIADDSTLVAMVDTDYGSWSVLDANNRSINFCFAGSRASQSREVWLSKFRNAIRIAAWTFAEDAKKYPYLRAVVQGRPYPKGDVACISDHNFVTRVLGIGTHTDVGPNFPWDVFEADLRAVLAPAPTAPVVNRIDECAGKNQWLGKRITVGEKVCPDRRGRFAKFENGYVYWTATTGAYAIPNRIFETWAEHGFEKGYGYPVNVATTINGGDIQAFERAVIYRQDGQVGHPVYGEIFKRYARDGYEPVLGWPIGDEHDNGTGGRIQSFEHADLIWDPSGVSKVVKK